MVTDQGDVQLPPWQLPLTGGFRLLPTATYHFYATAYAWLDDPAVVHMCPLYTIDTPTPPPPSTTPLPCDATAAHVVIPGAPLWQVVPIQSSATRVFSAQGSVLVEYPYNSGTLIALSQMPVAWSSMGSVNHPAPPGWYRFYSATNQQAELGICNPQPTATATTTRTTTATTTRTVTPTAMTPTPMMPTSVNPVCLTPSPEQPLECEIIHLLQTQVATPVLHTPTPGGIDGRNMQTPLALICERDPCYTMGVVRDEMAGLLQNIANHANAPDRAVFPFGDLCPALSSVVNLRLPPSGTTTGFCLFINATREVRYMSRQASVGLAALMLMTYIVLTIRRL